MPETVRQGGCPASAADIGAAVSRQREMLTDLLTVSLYQAARRLAPLVDIRHALEMLLIEEIEHLDYCRCMYVLDADGSQVTGSVGRDGVDRGRYGSGHAGREYLRHIIGFSDFRLSDVYFSATGGRPVVTAIQVMRDRYRRRAGFLGADFDLRELPLTGKLCAGLQQWPETWCTPGMPGDPFNRRRVDSVIDTRMGDVLGLLHELLVERGVFHVELHFSNDRATVWLADDPYRYRLLGSDALVDPDTCLAWPRRPYPDTALVPADTLRVVLEQFRKLRMTDEYTCLRSASLNIFNGTVGLEFSGGESCDMSCREFLAGDVHFPSGLRRAV